MQFPSARDIATTTNDPSVDSVKRATICAAIWTAVETSGTVTTASLDMSALTEENLIKVIKELREQGYQVTEGASAHITIVWPGQP